VRAIEHANLRLSLRKPLVRPCVLWLHRWVGLVIALFLFIEGITGALLSFNDAIRCALLAAHFTAHAPTSDARRLSPAELFNAAQGTLAPKGGVGYLLANREGQVIYRIGPRLDSAAGQPFEFPYDQVFIDPWTGKELGRLYSGGYTDGFLGNIMPVVYQLHTDLMLGSWGAWTLGIAAFAWTIDCFGGLYLTLPQHAGAFWRRWKPAWKVQWWRGLYRLNFDLHRAGGLWVWLPLLALAWSSVLLNDRLGVYAPVMSTVTNFHPGEFDVQLEKLYPHRPESGYPTVDAMAAEQIARKYLQEAGIREGFSVEEGVSLNHFAYATRYNYTARTNRRFPNDRDEVVFIDSNTGEFVGRISTSDGSWGNAVGNWLRALHMARDPLDYNWYRLLLTVAGIVLAMLSATGIYVWWKKLQARNAGRMLGHDRRPRTQSM
jgi:uncharacterized iron-regulated membrane protein